MATTRTLDETSELPLDAEGLTAEWLSGALREPVRDAVRDHLIGGTTTKVFITVTYGGGDPPQRLCVKGGFGDAVREFGTAAAYIAEARFYGLLAPRMDLRLPACHYAAIDPDNGQGIVILEDLHTRGVAFGEPTEPWPADRVAAALEQQAQWHAATWGGAGTQHAELPVGSTTVRTIAPMLLGPENWERQQSVAELPRFTGDLADPARIEHAFQRLWAFDDRADLCLAHGDAHIGNTFIDADGQPGFLDWQAPCLGPWSYDVAYFITGALEIDERRREQESLLRHYVAALHAAGGPAIGFDAAWLAYRRSSLHGFLWALTPPLMQPVERVAVMAQRHIAAIEDLETLTALERDH